jgi:hypothetical protein
MVSGAILAQQDKLEPELANSALGFGLPSSLITVSLASRLA